MTDVAVDSGILDANPNNTGVLCYTGRLFDVIDPDTWDFDITDIARALANICRFAGHVDFYSVAEHSIRVADMLKDRGYPEKVQLLGLLHDAAEAYIGDVPRPWKGEVRIGEYTYYEVESTIEHNIFNQFGLLDEYLGEPWNAVKQADMDLYVIERDARPTPSVMSCDPRAMSNIFLWKFKFLTDAIAAKEA